MKNLLLFFITGYECGGADILRVIKFIFTLLNIFLFIIPMGLIVMITVDFAKNVIAGRVEDMSKNLNIVIKRIIYCIALFLVPVIVKFAINLVSNFGSEAFQCIEIAITEDLSSYEIDMDKEFPVTTSDNNNNNNNSSSSGGNNSSNKNNSSTLSTPYSDEIVENLAAFIASEAGVEKKGFLAQLMTGAVYMNNYYSIINDTITIDNMCSMFSYAYVYTPNYCYLTFEKVESYRGKFSDSQKNQLLIVAKILLSKKFTIPRDIRYQAADYIIKNDGGTIWGTCDTGASVEAYKWAYFGCSKYDCPPVDDVDIYGNSVSNKFEDYQGKADSLFKKYVK